MLTTNTKLKDYQACVLSTLLYGSEAWSLYSRQQRRLNAVHMRCLRRLLGITWQDRVTNPDVMERANVPSIFAILTKRRLPWLGHVIRMDDGRIPKDLLCGELVTGTRPTGRPALLFKDICKRDMKDGGYNPPDLESAAADRSSWRTTTRAIVKEAEKGRNVRWEGKRLRRQQRLLSTPSDTQRPDSHRQPYTCCRCGRICISRIGLYSHTRHCGRSHP